MIRQSTPEHPPLTTTTSSSSCESRRLQRHRHSSKGRFWLWIFALAMVIAMVIGILFASHVYYHAMGGQGFLKSKRHEDAVHQQYNDTQLYLPMRKIEKIVQGRVFWELIGRAPKNIPFYTCGDQLNSCESFGQPDICCPVTMECYRASFTPSGIACCNSSANQFDCEPSKANPPKCITGTVQCSEATGGGCCPSVSECSPNGCIHVVSASVLGTSPTNLTSAGNIPSPISSTDSATHSSTSAAGTPLSTVTVTQQPESTQTLAKVGEVMQAKGSKGSIVMGLCVPYSTVCLLMGVATFMGFL